MRPQVQQVVAGSVSYERKVRAASETGLHLTDGQSNLRASATESKPPGVMRGLTSNNLLQSNELFVGLTPLGAR